MFENVTASKSFSFNKNFVVKILSTKSPILWRGQRLLFFSLFVLLLFTPSIFLSFLFSSIMFRHIHPWLQFSVAKISDTFEQHHPNPTWWPIAKSHVQFMTTIRSKSFSFFALKTRIGPTRVFVMSLPSKTSSSYFGVDISKEKALTSYDRLKVPQWTPREKLDLTSSWMSTASSGFTCWNCINPLGYKWREISTHICN